MAKRFVRSLGGAYKKLADKSTYVNSGSIIFNEDEKLITAWGKDYGLSEVNVTTSDTINGGGNNAVIQYNAGDSLIDSIAILGSNTSGKKINVTTNSSSDSITLEHETIATELKDSTSTVSTIADGGTFDLYMPIEYNNGHVTKLEKKRYKIDYPNYGLVSTTSNGLAPKITNNANDVIDSSTTDYVLTADDGTPKWMKLPTTAFENDNTTYTFTGGTNQFTVTPSSGAALTVTVTPSATISAGATDDDVVVLTGTPGTNGVSYDAKHAKTNVSYTSGVTGDTISGYGDTGTIKIPKITVNAYGHVTGITDQSVTITMPSELPLSNYKTKLTAVSSPSASGNATAFIDTISQNANGEITVTKKNITAADLGLSGAMHFIGVLETLPTDYTQYNNGDVVIVGSKEYVLATGSDGKAWHELGDESSHALKTIKVEGTGVLGGGGDLTTNRTITHNKVLGTAITTKKGGVSGNVITVPTIKADEYGHLTEVGTESWTYTIPTIPNSFGKVKVGTTEVAADAANDTLTLEAGTNITITPDATNDKITISSSDTTYSAGTGLTLSGTTFNHSNSITAGTAQGGSGTLTHGGTFTVPKITYDAQGHITSTGTTTYTLPTDNNTDTKVKNASSTSKVFILGQTTQGGDAAEAYTNASVYMQLGKLYSESYEVINSNDWDWEVLS